MTVLGVDSSGKLSGTAVAAAGYKFAVRYLPLGSWKSITKSELDDLVNHGVAVCLVFETTAGRATQGYAAGKADATTAVAQQASLGIPSEREIYYAVDSDVDPNTVVPYFQGVHDVHGTDGAYGGYRVVKRLQGSGLVKDLWQTVAWSGGQLLPGRALFQRLGTANVGGTACDVNEAFVTDFGQYPAPKTSGSTQPPKQTDPKPGDDVNLSDADKKWLKQTIEDHDASMVRTIEHYIAAAFEARMSDHNKSLLAKIKGVVQK